MPTSQRIIGLLALLSLGAAALAQSTPQGDLRTPQSPPPSTGSVSGTVIAQDTQHPARFAQVVMQNVLNATGDNSTRARFNGGGQVQTRTDENGTFLASDVLPGDYYVMAGAVGYLSERDVLEDALRAGADISQILADIPVVHVTADSTSTVNVGLQRGGSIAGKVQWDDGSPAAGVQVTVSPSVQPPALPDQLSQLQTPAGQTVVSADDRGNFRISGLATGDYYVQATISARIQFGGFGRQNLGPGAPIRIYAPGVFRKSDARTVSIREGDERTDIRMVIDLRGLHTVTGTASSTSAGQAVASGRVSLVDPNDRSLQLSGSIDRNGEFTVRYVPSGTYTLQVIGASSTTGNRRGDSQPQGITYQQSSQTVVVTDTDLTGVAVPLTPAQSSQQ